jgi:glycosyltransferase involved in cell wall biosynthesis
MRRLRVAHLTATYPPYLGGAGTTAWRTADELARRGHSVEVFTAAAPGVAPPDVATVHRMRPLAAVGNAPVLPRIALLRGFDLVHLHHPFIFGTELLHLARVRRPRPPLVVSYHNQLVGEGRRAPLFAAWERSWGRLTLRSAARICVVAHQHADTVPGLRRIAATDPDRLVEVPNGVDLETFRPGADTARLRERLGIGADAVVVAFVATIDRAHYLKRADLAVDAIAAAGDTRLHLLMIGGGGDLEALRARAAAAGIADRVTFVGAVGHHRLPEYLRAADLLLVTSDLESFGIVIIEAMACGLPTLSTDCVGPRAVLEDGVTGHLAPRGDVPALAAGLRAMADAGRQSREAMGAAARRRCEERFGWTGVVDCIEAVYEEALGGRT